MFCLGGGFFLSKKITVEEWEKRLNKLQSPKEIMDAIGVSGKINIWARPFHTFERNVGPAG
jgi:hypothetical protein